ncbi:MAG: PspC domain-containing protein, partial [Bacteroidales bacterium]|nr:PspC domain-containing protein [Bacteroidales bacterium]
MKKTININFQGQLITIEETAYDILNGYIQSLKDYFRQEAEGNEIVNDIENRIAELFGNRLKHGIPCITDDDVTSIIDTIGRPEEFDLEFDEREEEKENATMPPPHTQSGQSQMPPPVTEQEKKSLFRKSNDRILGGVCSGLAHYLKIDPVFVRLGFVFLSSLFFWVYIIMWIVLPTKELPNNVSKRLYRNPNDRFIAGVSGGIAAYFKIDTWIPRLIFLLPVILNVFGMARIPFNAFNHFIFNSSFPFNLSSSVNLSFVAIYIILWIIMP